MKKLKRACLDLVYRLLAIFGPGFSDRRFPVGLLFRHVIIQKVLRINAHVPWPVHWTSTVGTVKKIQRGSRFPGLSMNCYLDGRNGIIIGDNVWMGPRVSLISMNHQFDDFTKYVHENPIRIGDNCWLGANATILPGVELGNHVVVAANSVVTKSFLDQDILIAGVPARVIKKIKPYCK